jgi:predicted ATPase/DNA-binding winged helix-turn-helix (wHTH) protein
MRGKTYIFGLFSLHPEERLLFNDGRPAKLGSRAFDILVALVEAAGETVTHAEIAARAWPATTVDEGSLRVHISTLRKALRDGQGSNRFIVNVPGRGYRFVAPVASQFSHLAAATHDTKLTHNLPTPFASIIGRTETIATLAGHLSRRRLVAIVGTGGVGKTTVAIAATAAVKDSFRDGIWFVALDPAAECNSVASTIGAVLGLAEGGTDPMLALATWLQDKQALIVLDNCETVIDGAAAAAGTILRAAPQVSILATSREPLRVEGELSYRLKPLETPPVRDDVTANEALEYTSVQLFNERAQACSSDFALTDTNAPAVCEICSRLDGVPLALELAAVQVDLLSVQGLARKLDDRFTLLTRGRRTASRRQQTLRSTMDWSYSRLSEAEKIILRRVAIFVDHFTMQAASTVASDEQYPRIDVIRGVANLVTKSLITADTSRDVTYLRLHETTRIYALEKLADSREIEGVRERHVEYNRQMHLSAKGKIEFRLQPSGSPMMAPTLPMVISPPLDNFARWGHSVRRGTGSWHHTVQGR